MNNQLKLAAIFADNAVFAVNVPIRVFGDGHGKVEISFADITKTTISDNGKWLIEFPPMPCGGPYEMNIILNGQQRIIKNIAIGKVLLCAGQSNMQFRISEEKGNHPVVDNKNIRYYYSDNPEDHYGIQSKDGWVIANKDKIKSFSALAYHLAEKITERENVTAGIIACFQGASGIRSWMSENSLTKDVFVPLSERHADYSDPVYSSWNADSFLYNYTFLPIAPYAVSNVVWYQGESDTSVEEGKVYCAMLIKMIFDWRKELKNDCLPFFIVQICDLDCRADIGWKSIQSAQLSVHSKTNAVSTITSADVCSHDSIHPNDKHALADKIAKCIFESEGK